MASLGTVALLVVGALVLLPQDEKSPATDGAGGQASRTSEAAETSGTSGAAVNPAATPVRPGPAPGLSRIRPARAPGLCLTDGDVRGDGGESKVVAMQRPCGEAVPPKTYLLKTDDGFYRIQWDHPQHGKGCLTLLSDSDFQHMFEPWEDCEAGGSSQLFRIERTKGTDAADGWRLRPGRGDENVCVGMRGEAEEKGAVAVAEGCADPADGGRASDGQLFLIGPG